MKDIQCPDCGNENVPEDPQCSCGRIKISYIAGKHDLISRRRLNLFITLSLFPIVGLYFLLRLIRTRKYLISKNSLYWNIFFTIYLQVFNTVFLLLAFKIYYQPQV